jgi:hypothetical protein
MSRVVEQQLAASVSLRWARAGVLAAVVLIVSTLAHTAAGGVPPPVWGVLAMLVGATVVLAAVLGRPASRTRVVVLVAGGQAVLHVVMTAASGHVSAPAVGREHGQHPEHGEHGEHAVHAHRHAAQHAEQAHPDRVDASAGLADAWLHHLGEDLSGPTAAMGLAHLLAAAVLGWWVATGEQALWILLLLAAVVPACVLVLTRAALRVRLIAADDEPVRPEPPVGLLPEHLRRTSATLLRCVVPRRGPPEPARA